ncbi:amidase family protein [Marinobacter zhanjiangensis]|uniref:Amidase n=1 Tax=Marinobacter zhanjiangensis TaxID=578215 RepID=A0ABQ3AMM0_9GAMM|nr:amidase family protein [Marinobacter zhanjiangensis]GGY59659.1 amidase [Marinobacter zhanjiangensis]
MDFHRIPAFELARGIKARHYTSEQVLDHFLERTHRLNPALNAIVVLREDQAREQARDADRAAGDGVDLGPLHGVPMTIKETWELEGWPTTAGHKGYQDHVSPRTAVAVQRLLDAGAIIFGKTNVPEFAGDLQSFNDIYGTSNNPWNTDLTPGGSSGGAAAAMAAGLTPLELGSDIGGSIRTPAAFCGIYGLKTTLGLIPMRGHVPGAPGSVGKRDMGVGGPLTRHLDDLEAELELLAGPDDDMSAWQVNLPQPDPKPLADYRFATWLNDEWAPVDNEVLSGLIGFCEDLKSSGAAVEDARPEGLTLEKSHRLYYHLLGGAMGVGLPEKVRNRLAKIAAEEGDEYRHRFARAALQSHGEWLQKDEERAQLQRTWARFFEDHDLLICPVTNTLPFPHSQDTSAMERTLTINGKAEPYLDITAWAGVAMMVGLPAISFPVGFGDDGLPRAVQIIGPAWSEKTLIRVARLIQAQRFPDGLPWPDQS